MSQGMKTSEFYVTLGFILFTILARKFGIVISESEMMMLTAVVTGFVGSRTVLKYQANNTKADADPEPVVENKPTPAIKG